MNKKKKIKRICKNCKRAFCIPQWRLKYSACNFCSLPCYWSWQKGQRKGIDNPNWKGASTIRKDDYIVEMVVQDNYPGADERRRIFQHRRVMQEYLWKKGLLEKGKALPSKIRVHHKNGIKDDNGIKNLVLRTPKEHIKITDHYIKINYQGLNINMPKEIIYARIKNSIR